MEVRKLCTFPLFCSYMPHLVAVFVAPNDLISYFLFSDYIRSIKDPEKPATLEDLHVVYEDGIQVNPNWTFLLFFVKNSAEILIIVTTCFYFSQVKGVTPGNVKIVQIEFNPTVPHCSLATLIGLCIRVQLERTVAHSESFKLDIFIKKGAHNTEDESKYLVA